MVRSVKTKAIEQCKASLVLEKKELLLHHYKKFNLINSTFFVSSILAKREE